MDNYPANGPQLSNVMQRQKHDEKAKAGRYTLAVALAGLLAIGIALLTVSFQSVKAALLDR